MTIFKWTWWLTVRVVVVSWELIKKYFQVAFILVSLALNVTLFTGGTIYNVASSAFETVTGLRSIASQHALTIAELGNDLDFERKASRELRGKVADIRGNLVNEKQATKKLRSEISDVRGVLVSEKKISRKLRSDIVDVGDALANEKTLSGKLTTKLSDARANLVNEKNLSRKMRLKLAAASQDLSATRQLAKELRGKVDGANRRIVVYKGKKIALRKAVEITSDSVSKLAVKTSASAVGSMGGKAIPVIGTAVIVAGTAYEIYALCETIKEMNALEFAFNPDLQPGPEEKTVCATRIPTKEELWESTKASPGAAWKVAKKYTPSIGDIQNYNLPDVDWTGMWATTTGTAEKLTNSTAESAELTWEASKDGAGHAWEATTDVTSSFWDSIKEKAIALKNGDSAPDEKAPTTPVLATQSTSP